MTYPPEQVLLGGGVEDFRYLQVGVHAEPMLRGSGGGGAGRGAVLFVSLRSGLHMRVLWQLQTEEETQIWFVKMTDEYCSEFIHRQLLVYSLNPLSSKEIITGSEM